MRTRTLSILVVTLLAMTRNAPLRADVNALVNRVPAHTNAIVAVDVEQFRKAIGGVAPAPKSPVRLPKVEGLRAVILAAQLNMSTMEPAWEVALMETGQTTSIPSLAATTAGYVDTAAGKQAARTGSDAYVVALDERTLAVVVPADRQFASRWVKSAGTPDASDYLVGAAKQVTEQTPAVIAIDLGDVLSEPEVALTLNRDRPKWLSGLAGSDESLPKLFSSLRGVVLRLSSVNAEGATGTLLVDFGQSAAPLAPAAKDLVLGVLADGGLAVPELSRWDYSTDGNSLVGKGPLSMSSIQQLLSFLSMPAVSSPAAAPDARAAAQTSAPDPAQTRAQASSEYFKTVGGLLDKYTFGNSLDSSASWLTRTGNRIDDLPSDNVDDDLLAWGASVSSAMRQASSILQAGRHQIQARTSSVGVGGNYGGTDNDREAAARADVQNAQRQRQQVAAEEKTRILNDASRVLQAVQETRGPIRVEMVKRYGVGF